MTMKVTVENIEGNSTAEVYVWNRGAKCDSLGYTDIIEPGASKEFSIHEGRYITVVEK